MRLELGGKTFDLKPFTLNDWILAEDMGLDVQRLQKNDIKMKDMRTIVYVALKKADSTVTPEWVGENLDLNDTQVFVAIANFIKPSQNSKSEAI